jgi:hypothetical protein
VDVNRGERVPELAQRAGAHPPEAISVHDGQSPQLQLEEEVRSPFLGALQRLG